MKKTTKRLVALLLTGLCGIAVTAGYIIGSGQLASREARKEYAVSEPFETVRLETCAARVRFVPSQQTRVAAYVKAWLPAPVDMDERVDVRVEDGVLTVTETPFEPAFIGVFPQPYEMQITVWMPREIAAAYEEDEA